LRLGAAGATIGSVVDFEGCCGDGVVAVMVVGNFGAGLTGSCDTMLAAGAGATVVGFVSLVVDAATAAGFSSDLIASGLVVVVVTTLTGATATGVVIFSGVGVGVGIGDGVFESLVGTASLALNIAEKRFSKLDDEPESDRKPFRFDCSFREREREREKQEIHSRNSLTRNPFPSLSRCSSLTTRINSEMHE
jgi:hypothetical protein